MKFKQIRHYGIYCIVCIVMIGSTATQNIWRKVNAYKYELSFYQDHATSYSNAKEICTSTGAELVQLDDEYVRNAVYFTLDAVETNIFFWIGARRNNLTKSLWNWEDGSQVNLTLLHWREGQPDNSGMKEDNIIIRVNDKTISDIPFNYQYAGTICQKKEGISNSWKLDTPTYKLTFYDSKSNWNTAKKKCDDIGASMIQLDDDDVKKAVYGVIKKTSTVNFFWIGATGQLNNWKWLDNTPVADNLITWYENQPDNYGGWEDKLVIRIENKKFGDIRADKSFPGTICQALQDCDVNNICENGGACESNTAGGFSCVCGSEYYRATCSDKYCDEYIDTCTNNGMCLSTTESPFFICNCTQNGYYGDTCEDNYCTTNPTTCKNQGTCLYDSTSPFYTCTCASNGYYGNMCEDKYCDRHTNPCQNLGQCISTHGGTPFYKCKCAETGYYGDVCEVEYCTHHENPCENNGKCYSTHTVTPFYNCDCVGTGYYGDNCTAELIQISSNANYTGIVGSNAKIDIYVTSLDGLVTINVYKGNMITSQPLKGKGSVGNGTTTFSLYIKNIADEGNYLFVANSSSNTSRSTILYITVHVRANITAISHLFIFSPVTNGSSEVRCEAYGIPLPDVTWIDSTNKSVPVLKNKGIYQINTFNIATLHIEDAFLGDQGIYTCTATNIVGQEAMTTVVSEHVQLAVYGNPKIISVDATPCAEKGKLTVKWEPNDQTTEIFHRFVATSVNASIPHNKTIYARIDAGANVVLENLESFTLYNITVHVCPDKCLSNLKDSKEQTTGYGLPESVRDPRVERNTDLNNCIVNWNPPESHNDQLTGYEIYIEEKWVYQPPDLISIQFNLKYSKNIEAQNTTFILNTQSNRNYNFNITAKTCTGEGDIAQVNGKCITKRSAPSTVPLAILKESSESGPTREIIVPLANEANGPVSCSFVVVNKGNKIKANSTFGLPELRDAENAALTENVGVDYLTIAIPRESIVGNIFTTVLGNGKSSACDVSKIFNGNNRKKRNSEILSMYKGNNKVLSTDGTEYGFFTVTTTPVENGDPLFQRSPVQSFINGQSTSLLWIIGVLGGILFIVLIGASFYIFKRRVTKKHADDSGTKLSKISGNDNLAAAEDEIIYENVEIDETKSVTDIPLVLLQHQYKILKADESIQFRKQFKELKAKSKMNPPPATFGSSEDMMPKNRYKNILPYDSTRVQLKRNGNDGYVNANRINGINKRYIATQGPLPKTVPDFWQMVIEQRCHVIVMLTKCEEAGRKKCEKYWPDYNQTMQHEEINILNQEEIQYGGYVKRILKISLAQNEELEVTHYQFLKWPDHGVPATTSCFFRLYKAVMESFDNIRQNIPLLVHCSAGVGRTGAFIGYDMLHEISQNRNSVDIYDCVLSMRKERMDMVQTFDQYELLHKLILEQYLFGETDIEEEVFRRNQEQIQKIPKNETIEKEFQNLEVAQSLNPIFERNNQSDTPVHSNRVVIVRQPEDTEWITIDATYLESYDKKTQLIAAESPLNSTMEYFLRALLDNNIDVVVMLDPSFPQKSAQSGGFQYWPQSSNEPLVVNNITVHLEQQENRQCITERKLILSRNSQQRRAVTHYQFENWSSDEQQSDATGILELLSTLHDYTRIRNASVILVHCCDGIGKTGVFCALINIFERMKQEKMVDVFRAVKDLHDLKPEMVQTLSQYEFCYKVVQSHLSIQNIYENVPEIAREEEPVYQNMHD